MRPLQGLQKPGQGHDDLLLAYCWAHVRRDFLKAARSWPELGRWMFTWVDDIRELYRLNAARLEPWEGLPLHQQPCGFCPEPTRPGEATASDARSFEAHLQETDLHLGKRRC